MDKKITFIHATPGFVNTGTSRASYPSRKKEGWFKWLLVTIFQSVSGWITTHFGKSAEESGERHAYYLTSPTYTPGSWRADKHNDIQEDNKTLRDYKQRGWAERSGNILKSRGTGHWPRLRPVYHWAE